MSYLIRPYLPSDLAAVADVLNTAANHDEYRLTSVDALAQQFQEPGYDPCKQGLVALDTQGQLVGFRMYRRRYNHGEPVTIYDLLGGAHPQHLAADVELIRVVSTSALGDAHLKGEAQARVHVRCFDDDYALQQSLAAEGFQTERHLVIMRRELSQPPASAPSLPDFCWSTCSDPKAWYDAYADAFADHWGQMIMPRGLWTYIVQQPHYHPELNILALTTDTQEIAGFCYTKMLSNARGEIRWLGVRPRWRRRGLADALTKAGLWALYAHGARECVLGADADSATSPVRVYERNGFTIVRHQHVYARQLS